MIANMNKPKLKIEILPKYISASALNAYETMSNTFFVEKCIHDRKPRTPAGLAANVGTAFDIAVKLKLIDKGVGICGRMTREQIEDSLDINEHTPKARDLGKRILMEYTRAGLLRNSPSAPLRRAFHQVEGKIEFVIGGVPILAMLDAIVTDESTGELAPFDWKVIGGAAESGASAKKGYAGTCDCGQWDNKGHKSYHKEIPIEEIDKAFGTQFTMYGWAVQSLAAPQSQVSLDFKPFPVHFDSAVFNGAGRNIKIYAYRAIATVEWQEKVYKRLKKMWNDLTERDGEKLLDRLESRINLASVKDAAGRESWF